MKKGYLVGEYIIVVFFFLILFVGIVDRVILVTSEEVILTQEHESCESAERLFKELIDNEDDVSKYGVTGGDSIVNYNATKFLHNNKHLGDYNTDTNKTDSFQLAYEIKGFDVQSAYSTKLTDFTTTSPKVQIWLNQTNDVGPNLNKVHNVVSLAAGGNTSAIFKISLFFPNATTLDHISSIESNDSIIADSNPEGLNYELVWNTDAGDEDTIYISYTTDTSLHADWDKDWTRYNGTNFEAINDIQRNNNLVFIRDISFRNEALDIDYPIYLGNDTLVKMNWGAPIAEGCEYKRLYKIESNESFLINQTIFNEPREVNITRNFIGEVKIISA